MKIVFNTLRTDAETIKVSFDGGNSWASVNTDDARTHGITFSFGEGAGYDCNDLSKIQIKGSFKTLTSKDIRAVAKAEKDRAVSVKKAPSASLKNKEHMNKRVSYTNKVGEITFTVYK